MKNIHNTNISKTLIREAIKTTLFYKDQHGRLRKKTNDYSGLQATFANELYIDGGVVRARKKDSSDKQS